MRIKVIVRDIKINPDIPREYALKKAENTVKTLAGTKSVYSSTLSKLSVDSRHKNDIKFVCTVIVECEYNGDLSGLTKAGLELYSEEVLEIKHGDKPQKGKIAVIGFGPAGMFASLLLSENGYDIIVIERGSNAETRGSKINNFYKTGILDGECNIQFGAGGAGMFSDGKLVTRINDPKCAYVLKRFVQFGAPEQILYAAKPHLGTDRLQGIISNIAKAVVDNGGEILFDTSLTDIKSKDGGAEIFLSNGTSIFCDAVVLAIGHSSRDTIKTLYSDGIPMEKKSFSIGVRVEHLQSDINRALYGSSLDKYGDKLPAGEYSLSYRGDGRGVYSFCMCPGGNVVAAASEQGGVVTNGMSYYARNGKYANSAIAVSVNPTDIEGSSALSGFEFQRSIEQACYMAAGGGFKAPVQCTGDFLNGRISSEPSRITPTYPLGFKICDLNTILPAFICRSLKMGLLDFDKKIKGFASGDVPLTAPETRTSSPIRIPRTEYGFSSEFPYLYPCGEGAGYAGGITSAATDGVKTALKIMEVYKSKI